MSSDSHDLTPEKKAQLSKVRETLREVQAAKLAEKESQLTKPKKTPAARSRKKDPAPEKNPVSMEEMTPKIRKPTKAQLLTAEKVFAYEKSLEPAPEPEEDAEDAEEQDFDAEELVIDDDHAPPVAARAIAVGNPPTRGGSGGKRSGPPEKDPKKIEYERVGREVLKQRKWEARQKELLENVRNYIQTEYVGRDEEPEFYQEANTAPAVDISGLYDDAAFFRMFPQEQPKAGPKQKKKPKIVVDINDLY